jgi:hypothetical protein
MGESARRREPIRTRVRVVLVRTRWRGRWGETDDGARGHNLHRGRAGSDSISS